ncbi:MAG: glycosyl hydrolase [Bacteroidales bacterium]
MYKLKFLLLAGCLLVISYNTQETITVNSNATPETQALLENIYKWKGEKLLSGQHNYARSLMRSFDSVRNITNKTPVIWGSDFGVGRKSYRDRMVQKAIEMHKAGHIITLMYHQGCPVDTIPGDINPVRYKMSEQEWNDLVTTGSRFNNIWLKDIDEVAEHFKILQDARVPVLWRPYHEMNGMWFWWGDKRGENGIQELWKQMYNRFTNYHGLNNIIWVWNANAPRDWIDDEAYAYELFYPGPEFVDILAADVYKGDYKQSHHDELLALANGKPIALGEIGVAPDTAIFASQNEWSWFMMWASWPWKYNTPEQLNELYDYSKTIDFDEFIEIDK